MVGELRSVSIKGGNCFIQKTNWSPKFLSLISELYESDKNPEKDLDLLITFLLASRMVMDTNDFVLNKLVILNKKKKSLNGFAFSFYDYAPFQLITIDELLLTRHEGIKLLPPPFIIDLSQMIAKYGPIKENVHTPCDLEGFNNFFNQEEVIRLLEPEFNRVVHYADHFKGCQKVMDYGHVHKRKGTEVIFKVPFSTDLHCPYEESFDNLTKIYHFSDAFAEPGDHVAIMCMNHGFKSYINVDWTLENKHRDRQGTLMRVLIGEEGKSLSSIINNVYRKLNLRKGLMGNLFPYIDKYHIRKYGEWC